MDLGRERVNIQYGIKKLVTFHFTHVAYIEYYLRNAYLCGYLIGKHMKISYKNYRYSKLENHINTVFIQDNYYYNINPNFSNSPLSPYARLPLLHYFSCFFSLSL